MIMRAFASAEAFETWLARHHASETEIYLRIYKKDSGVRSVNHAEALDVALCFGWIDGVRKSHDAQSFLQRFTPRRKKSRWSRINRDHVARLIAAGRMTPHGLREVEAAKADGRWEAAYESPRNATIPEDLRAAIAAEPKARATFETLNNQNRFALAYRLANVKTQAARERNIARFVALLKRGETLHPNGARKAAAKKTAATPKKRGRAQAARSKSVSR